MNVLDAFAIVVIAIAVFAGYRSGAIPQIGGLLGAVAGGGLVLLGLPFILERLADFEPTTRAGLVLAGMLLSVAIGETIGSALGSMAARGLGRGILSTLDQGAGAIVGLAQGILVVWLAGGLLAAGPLTPGPLARLTNLAQTSGIVRGLSSVLPPPAEVAADLGRVLDTTGLPDVFVGLEPLPAPPVDLPSDPESRRIAGLAQASVVKVSSTACGYQLTGTGVVVGRGYVVTNAHVVAGARGTKVAGRNGLADATPVLFDPELDVALLYAPRLDAPSLRFATAEPDRGSAGAALGYPGGGPLRIVPAAVARQLSATGRDIYDQDRVTRSVLELHAEIERGDSGGPFVLGDGTIGGIVFAEARTDPEVGYALSPTAVATRVQPSLGRTGAVGTGECLR